MLMGGLAGAALAVVLYYFEYSSITRALSERAKRLHVKKVEMDGSERARLKNLLWFCILMPAIGAGLGWLLG
ncbi:MAG TPA: hypothetical protein VGP71_12780 [Burkholderiales bacterium]|nr:hypothetical protein [Burkholderiales bacterium]